MTPPPVIRLRSRLPRHWLRRNVLGGKGYYLMRLREWGFPVPPFLVLSSTFCARLLSRGAVPDAWWSRVRAEIRSWSPTALAVRSSMSVEDTDHASGAGIMDTFLNVPPEALVEHVRACAASLHRERSRAYRDRMVLGVAAGPPRAAVIVQAMVAAEKAGVAFSRSPVGNSALICVEAAPGSGEAVVAGKIEVDRIWLDRFGAVLKTELREGAMEPVLVTAELHALVSMLLKIEARLARPCDVEWAWAGESLQVLQARPITHSLPELRTYVDTNLAESYPGKTSPLSASFVKRLYSATFRESFTLLTGSRCIPAALARCYDELLSEFDGHLYYNLASYYTVLTSMPGGLANVDNWHRMIGGRPEAAMAVVRPFHPGPWNTLKVVARLAGLALNHRQVYAAFLAKGDALVRRLHRKLVTARDAQAAAGLIVSSLDSAHGFSLTIVNDLFIMLGLRGLAALLARQGYSESLLPLLIRPRESTESTRLVRDLDALIRLLHAHPEALAAAEKRWAETAKAEAGAFYAAWLREMDERGFVDLRAIIIEYLSRYGERCFEELKLESLPFKLSPGAFLRFLRWNLNHARPAAASPPPPPMLPAPIRPNTRLERRLFGRVLDFTRRAITAREDTRLLRARVFGLFREAFIHWASLMKLEHPEAWSGIDPSSDVFWLTLDELARFAAGGDPAALAAVIRERRAADRPIPAWPEFFCHPVDPGRTVEPSYLMTFTGTEPATPDADRILRGLGASPGRVSGTALVLHHPQDAFAAGSLARNILVARNTDPAWVFLLKECRGLVTEKGSLLSHTAIIGREFGVPTVVDVRRATSLIQTGRLIEIDGKEGRVRLL